MFGKFVDSLLMRSKAYKRQKKFFDRGGSREYVEMRIARISLTRALKLATINVATFLLENIRGMIEGVAHAVCFIINIVLYPPLIVYKVYRYFVNLWYAFIYNRYFKEVKK